MTKTSKEIDVGRRIAACRVRRGLSQAVVSRRAGIDPSYLSRIENQKVQPTVRTALRIAEAMRVPLGELLEPSPAEQKGQPCPVSIGGSCLLDLIDTGPRARGKRHAGAETYSPEQIRLLRRLTALVQQTSPKTLKALEVLLGEIVEGGVRRRDVTGSNENVSAETFQPNRK